LTDRVFVDCDLTLVNTEIYPFFSRHLFSSRRRFFFHWSNVLSEARPSAKPFLEDVGRKHEVAMLTLGHSQFQRRVLKELGLGDLVGDIFGPDNCDLVPPTESFVLIDDMEPYSLAIAYKMRWLGHQKTLENIKQWPAFLTHHIIQCRPFTGGKEDSEPLTDFLPLVHARMQTRQEL
jgi:hypothetical protein